MFTRRPECQQLDLLPVEPATGLHEPDTATWGGSIVHGDDGRLYMYAAEMVGNWCVSLRTLPAVLPASLLHCFNGTRTCHTRLPCECTSCWFVCICARLMRGRRSRWLRLHVCVCGGGGGSRDATVASVHGHATRASSWPRLTTSASSSRWRRSSTVCSRTSPWQHVRPVASTSSSSRPPSSGAALASHSASQSSSALVVTRRTATPADPRASTSARRAKQPRSAMTSTKTTGAATPSVSRRTQYITNDNTTRVFHPAPSRLESKKKKVLVTSHYIYIDWGFRFMAWSHSPRGPFSTPVIVYNGSDRAVPPPLNSSTPLGGATGDTNLAAVVLGKRSMVNDVSPACALVGVCK